MHIHQKKNYTHTILLILTQNPSNAVGKVHRERAASEQLLRSSRPPFQSLKRNTIMQNGRGRDVLKN